MLLKLSFSTMSRAAFICFLSLNLISCASKVPPKQAQIILPTQPQTDVYEGHYKVGTPYVVNQELYIPEEDHTYKEEGVASWYGGKDGFHGKKTANGDTYNKLALTGAHRTLPMPSAVRVTNTENNRSVVVMVNDRGPFSKKRIIDVSERAAEILKMKIKGSAKVKVEYLPKETEELLAKLALPAVNGAKAKSKGVNVATKYLESINDIVKIELASAEKPNKIKTVGKGGKKIFIQVGAFKHKNNALTVATQLAKLGKLDVKNPTSKANPLYKVHLGPIDDHQAEQILSELISLGNDAKIIKNPDSRG